VIRVGSRRKAVLCATVSREVYEALRERAAGAGRGALSSLVEEALRAYLGLRGRSEGAAGAGAAELSKVWERLRELEERLHFVEKFLEDAFYLKAAPTATTATTAVPAAPAPAAPSSEARAVGEGTAIEVGEVKEPKEPKEVRRGPKRGVFKVFTTGWIRARRGKEPEEFMREWEGMGCAAALLPGGDKVLVVSDDVVEETMARLNEMRVRLGQLSELQDEELKKRAMNLSLAGLIYFDSTREEWRRA